MVLNSAFVYAATAILCILTGIATWIWLWLSRDKNLSQVPVEVEWRRAVVHLIWLAIYFLPILIYFAVLFIYENPDGTWHQTIVRDESQLDYQRLLKTIAVAIFLISGMGSFLHAKTRLPFFAKRKNICYWLFIFMPYVYINLNYIYYLAGPSMQNMELYVNIFNFLSVLWLLSMSVVLYQVFVNLCQVRRKYRQSQT